MTKRIVKVEDKKEEKGKLDLNKIKDVIVDNKETIIKIVDIAGDLLDDEKDDKKTAKKVSKKESTSKSSKTKKTTTKKNSDLDTMIDLASKFLK